MNGALTIQIVDGAAAGGVIEATVPTAAGGYRLKKDSTSQGRQLAQYTVFWHHPNHLCIADSGWTKTPPLDVVSDVSQLVPAAGSADPNGVLMVGNNGELIGGQLGSSSTYTSYNGVEVLVTSTYSADGVTKTYRCKVTSATCVAGTVLYTTLLGFGSLEAGDRQLGNRSRVGRLGWRELVR